MIKFLVTILAGIMMVSSSFAGPATVKAKEAKEAREEALKNAQGANTESEKNAEIKKLYEAIVGARDVNSEKSIAKMKELFTSTDSFFDAMKAYTKATNSQDPLIKNVSSHVRYVLTKQVKGEFDNSPEAKDLVQALLGAAKTVITEGKDNADMVSKLAKQLSAFNNGTVKLGLSAGDASLLSFDASVNGANKSYTSVDAMKKDLGDEKFEELKKQHEEWKNNCKKGI